MPVLLPHLAQALVGDGDAGVWINAGTAVGQLVTAAPGLAAEALSHVAQALVGDGDVDVQVNAVTAVGQLVAAVPGLAAEACRTWHRLLLGMGTGMFRSML